MANWKEPKNDYKKEDQVVPEIFNTLAENERYLQEKKITTEQVQDAVVNSTESTSRETIGGSETVKGFFGKVRKWFADLKALAFKASVGTSDIDSSAVTTAKLASKAVTDSKIDTVSASKVTGLAAVATSGSYNDLLDKPSIGSGGGFFSPTFIVDSDAALEQWANNDKTCDFSRVLIKKGTWKSSLQVKYLNYQYRQESKVGINLTQTKTKMIVGEEGSKLYFFVDEGSPRDINGLAYEYGDLRAETDKGYLIYNVTVESHGENVVTDQSCCCFSGCCNLIDCKAISGNGYDGFGFSSCCNLTNCTAEASAQNFAAAFSGGKNMTRCVGHANVWQADRKWGGGCSAGLRNCERITNCKGSATCTPATADYTAYGFSGCKAVSRCSKNQQSSTATFSNSHYSNKADATYVCDNTLNGGFNDTSN